MVLLQLKTDKQNALLRYVLTALVVLGLAAYFTGSDGVKAAAPIPTYHDLHVKDQGLECESCHAPQLKVAREGCQECHDAGEIESLLDAFTTQVQNLGPPVPPEDHTQDYRRGHGVFAQVDNERCTRCHQERFCQDCHEGVNLQGGIHPLNFRNTHGFEAQGQEQDCLVCHETRDFCVGCHQQEQVLAHPLGGGWANSNGGEHAADAEGNLESCLACHDLGSADPTCIQPGCHTPGGGGE